MHVSVGVARAWLNMVSAGETASMPVKAHQDIGMDRVALKMDRLSPRDGGITGHNLHQGQGSSMQAVQLSNVLVTPQVGSLVALWKTCYDAIRCGASAVRRTTRSDGGWRRRSSSQNMLLHASARLQLLPVPPRDQRVAVMLLRVLARCAVHTTVHHVCCCLERRRNGEQLGGSFSLARCTHKSLCILACESKRVGSSPTSVLNICDWRDH